MKLIFFQNQFFILLVCRSGGIHIHLLSFWFRTDDVVNFVDDDVDDDH